MSNTMTPPASPADPVVDVLHGVSVADAYRWLEDAESPETSAWLEEQAKYARAYLEHLPGRDAVRERIRELLTVETHDSFFVARNRYIFRKRLAHEEQPAIYLREGIGGADQLLIDPGRRSTGKYAAVKPVHLSADGRLLLYEVKDGGERTSVFEIFDIERRSVLPDALPHGFLRGFAFARDGGGFYYSHEPLDGKRPFYRAAYHHVLNTPMEEDRRIFSVGEARDLRLFLAADEIHIGFLAIRYAQTPRSDFYVKDIGTDSLPAPVFTEASFKFSPRLVHGRIFASTDRDAPNLRIVELRPVAPGEFDWREIVPETDSRIHQWIIAGKHIVVSYIRQTETRVSVFSLDGTHESDWPVRSGGRTVRFLAGSVETDELLFETETFTHPPAVLSSAVSTNRFDLLASRKVPFSSEAYAQTEIRYRSKDGTEIPMFLVGRREVLKGGCHPAILTSYGGYGVAMTAQFSVFVAFLMERGCLFALPQIRGGSECGAAWHAAAKRRNRQNAYDDFLAAAEWLIRHGRTRPEKLAIFGGSNSGLLVGAALTQRPDLFRAVVCLAPLLDMLRYHLFDNAFVWRDEFGTADDPDDFRALLAYSPYHHIRDGVSYPAALIVSGARDQSCNPLHARKMTARLQAASSSGLPILLDYTRFRGHSPVLPLSDRIEALTDRMAFVCDQLGIQV